MEMDSFISDIVRCKGNLGKSEKGWKGGVGSKVVWKVLKFLKLSFVVCEPSLMVS